MKRRLFAKNLAALLAIPFVAKADEYVPKVEEKVVEEIIEFSEEVRENKFLGNNTMSLFTKDGMAKLLLSEISMNTSRSVSEFLTDWEPDVKYQVYGAYESKVCFAGKIITSSIKDYFQPVEFTVFLNKDCYLEGKGFITEFSMSHLINDESTIEMEMEIDGKVFGNYEGY